MKSYRTPTDSCPACGHLITRAAGEVRRPEPGDLSFCLYCHTLLTFTWDLKLRRTTPEELATLNQKERDDLAQRQQQLIAGLKP